MPPQPERQLLAVLFADIQGYTAMMQTDEAGGRLVLRNFKETLTEQVPAFNGQIINFYGDGCLCTFKDSVKAANCAIKLQHLFRIAEPSTPVRIGLHKGYVSFEDGNAYGDAVNITSRIESFGVPNAVLISDKMRQEVVSKTAYQSVLLGTFQFKNVEKPMQIHALKGEGLVVPQKETLKGKGKLLPSKETKIKKWAIGALVLGLLLVINFYNPLATFSNSASKSLREARIAVLPFENKTGDAKLDIIGDMASDWVIQGLMYLDDIQLVGFENIQENIQYASIGDSSGSFARRTGAEKVVRGRYYISGDELIFQSQIIDLETGKIELTLPKVSGPKDDNAALVSELQAKFVTAFEAQDHNFSPGIAQNPPPHQAYQLFREGIDIYSEDAVESRNLFAQAIEMDSSFFWPYVWATASFFNEGKGQQADSTFALITQKIDFKSLNSFDRQWYTHWKALLDKDLPKAFKASLKILEKDPKQWFSNVEAGIIANNLNRPEKAVEIFKYLDPAHAPQDIELDTWWHNYYAHNLFRVDRFAEA
ncbi:MAG: adenylate/guanylate cyclase domain-containing protein, partial [Bacteroidota bacterium]